MATIASSNFVTMAYQEETTEGTLPVTGTFRYTPMTGESLQLSKESITSNNINSTRQVTDVIQTGFDVSGGIEIELAAKTFDEFMEGALWGNWSTIVDEDFLATELSVVTGSGDATITASGTATPTFQTDLVTGQFVQISGMDDAGNNGVFQVSAITSELIIVVLDVDGVMANGDSGATGRLCASMIRNGTDRHSYVMEKALNDLTPVQMFYYLGCLINSLSLSIQSSSIITGSIDMLGATSDSYDDGTKSTAAIDDSVGNNIINAVSHVEGVRIDGVEQSAQNVYFQGIDMTLSNNLRGIQAVGNVGNVGVSPGQMEVTGTMNTYFANDDMYTRFNADTEFSLSYSMIDGNNEGYVISFPRVVVTSDDLAAGGNDTDMVENLAWSAMMSASDDIAPSITIQVDRFYLDYTDVPDA